MLERANIAVLMGYITFYFVFSFYIEMFMIRIPNKKGNASTFLKKVSVATQSLGSINFLSS